MLHMWDRIIPYEVYISLTVRRSSYKVSAHSKQRLGYCQSHHGVYVIIPDTCVSEVVLLSFLPTFRVVICRNVDETPSMCMCVCCVATE